MFSNIFASSSEITSLVNDLKTKKKAKNASESLAKIGSPAVTQLIIALEGNNKQQKRYTARAIREMGQDGSDAIPALSKLINDGDSQTREYVVEALGQMVRQAEQVRSLLRKATKDRDKSVREKAQNAMSNLPLTKPEIEKYVQKQINDYDNSNKCTSVLLKPEAPDKYRGYVKLANGNEIALSVTVLGNKVNYSLLNKHNKFDMPAQDQLKIKSADVKPSIEIKHSIPDVKVSTEESEDITKRTIELENEIVSLTSHIRKLEETIQSLKSVMLQSELDIS